VSGEIEVPRLWVSPTGEVIELGDGGDGHGMWVAKDPERFGLPAGHFDEHLAAVGDAGQDVEFDYDAAIAMAESVGWARVSRDAKSGVAIGAATVKAAQRAARVLVGRGVAMSRLDVEIECVRGDRIVAVLHELQGDAMDLFVRFGRVGHGRRHELPLSAPELAVLDRRPAMAM
jgi:hypothetical protein